ncbi:DUF742 domain-containing protein [Gandjariella thermophila]|uniref:DUF742 domain-containing protein n=1 Tax=Gandjariella thermophila TaxID=1931992 RepID=A0A4D4JCM7_9PSEU|nr:DUF742 domain-containing protein [Gandjariella thermophila]GDY32196.1 hypothetical protein GTS_38290 [Gandjariella thermophila]
MSNGAGSEQNSEQTFADLLQGFTLDSGVGRRRQRERSQPEPQAEPPRRREAGHRQPEPVAGERGAPAPYPDGGEYGEYGQPRRGMTPPPAGTAAYETQARHAYEGEPEYEETEEDAAAIVRAYAWTRGRTKSDYHLEIETLVSTSERGYNAAALAQAEHRAVASLCAQPRSVAEVAALLSLPLGVAKVLLGDMAGLGLINVHQNASTDGDKPDLALMERVLSGLRRL